MGKESTLRKEEKSEGKKVLRKKKNTSREKRDNENEHANEKKNKDKKRERGVVFKRDKFILEFFSFGRIIKKIH